MKNYKLFIATAALLITVAAPLGAQSVGTAISITTPPIHRKGVVWLKAEIVHADARSMIVRQHGNELAIYTFTYAEGIQGSMQQIAEAGGYQYGDHVKILFQPGQFVALKVRGKPSKPF